MTSRDKRRRKILKEKASSIRFEEICNFLESNGFVGRQKSTSHRAYSHPDHPTAFVNIQSEKGLAKEYQVEQVRKLFDQLNL